eukprot:m.36905 g.36905  ORF g.36905 m.36905 type:complete len:627 (-) comp9201_c1_seq1:78-1958(-)
MSELRGKQLRLIRSMFGSKEDELFDSLASEPEWKVLVYDRYGQDILSPVISVPELRDLGVTLYLQLDSEREPIPATCVVYFVNATEANINRICKDMEKHLYDRYQFNFLSNISRNLLEQLAESAHKAAASTTVQKVYDLYSNFICLEDDLFMLRQQNKEPISFVALNGPASDAEMSATLDDITESLFCAVVTLGVIPIIRCSRGHAAEEIGKRLDSKLRKAAKSNLFTESMSSTGSFQRPLLALIDRHIDFATILHHTWTYQGLLHDIMDYKLNRVVVSTVEKKQDGPERAVKKTYDLDSKSDEFWADNRSKQWPEVVIESEAKLKEVRDKESELRMKPGSNEAVDVAEDFAGNTARIKEAVATLPLLMARKKQLDNHMSLLTSVVDVINARVLNEYLELEEQIISEASLSRPVMELIQPSAKGSLEDKMRLLLIYVLSPTAKQAIVEKCEASLKEQGCDMSALQFVRDQKKLHSLTAHRKQAQAKEKEQSAIWQGLGHVTSYGVDFLKKGMKKVMVTAGDFPTTQIVDALMEFKSTELTNGFLYLDPKQLNTSQSSTVPKGRPPFDEAMVFMVGGGNFTEYQNLQEAMGKKEKKIVYGCTELLTPEQFLSQMGRLGRGEGVASGQ